MELNQNPKWVNFFKKMGGLAKGKNMFDAQEMCTVGQRRGVLLGYLLRLLGTTNQGDLRVVRQIIRLVPVMLEGHHTEKGCSSSA